MNEAEANARVAALATQVAIVHNALAAMVDETAGDPANTETYAPSMATAAAARAALATSEPDCADLLKLARETVEANGPGYVGDKATALRALLDRIEGKAAA